MRKNYELMCKSNLRPDGVLAITVVSALYQRSTSQLFSPCRSERILGALFFQVLNFVRTVHVHVLCVHVLVASSKFSTAIV